MKTWTAVWRGHTATALLIGLTACPSLQQDPAPVSLTSSDVAPAVVAPATSPATSADEPSSAVQPIAALPPGALPEELLGLDRSTLNSKLGTPSLIRTDAPAVVWQYVGRSCVFDIFLYDDDSGEPRVTYLEARDLRAKVTDQNTCLSAIVSERRNRPQA